MQQAYSKLMRKNGPILIVGAALLCLLLIRNAPAIQFFKPNRGARLIVYLKAKEHFSSWNHVVVTVMLSNQTQGTLLINSRMRTNRYPLDGELSFIVLGPHEKEFKLQKAVTPRDLLDGELSTLRIGETTEQAVDLTELYGVSKHGTYRVQVLYYNRFDLEKNGLKTWRGVIASEPVEFTLQ
jgi:hypothetical protein